MKKILIFFLLCVFALTLCAKNRTVEAIGSGETLETALLNAQRRAVMSVLWNITSSKTTRKEIIKATVGASQEFVVSSQLLHSTDKYLPRPGGPTKYLVKIQAEVDADKIKEFVSRMRGSPGNDATAKSESAPAPEAAHPASEAASHALIGIPHRTVEAEGLGETVEAALHNARRVAVRKAFGEVVDSRAEMNGEKFEEENISASRGFIMSYEMIGSPERLPDGAGCKVKIRAVVATEKAEWRTVRSANATGNTLTVEADGVGETLKEAMSDARRNAVRKAFGEVVDSIAELRNEKFDESTITVSSGFIVSATRLGAPERLPEHGGYRIRIRAVVSKDKIKDHINRFRTRSAKIDVSAQLRAAKAAEDQEKNAMEMLLRFDVDFFTTLVVSDFKYSLKNGSLFLSVDIGLDRNRFEELKNEFRRQLAACGYVRIGSTDDPLFKRCRTGGKVGFVPESCSKCNRGYSPPFPMRPCARWEHNEWYCSENVGIRADGANVPRNDPRNFEARSGKKTIEFELVKADGSRVGIGSSNADNAFLSSNWWISLYSGKGFRDHRLSTKCQLTADLRGVVAAELVVIHDRPDGRRSTTIGRIPVNMDNIFTQAESMDERRNDYVKLISRYVREFNKTVVPKAEMKYDRFSGNVKLSVELTFDRRGFFSTLRKMESQLGQLGIRHNLPVRRPWSYGVKGAYQIVVYNGDPREVDNMRMRPAPIPPPGRYVNGVWVQPPAPPPPPDDWPRHFCIPDGDQRISRALYPLLGNSLNYVLVVRFKDAAGDVLHTSDIPVTELMPVKVWDWYAEVSMITKSFEITCMVNSEDIPKIRDIEYVIEERVRQ